jgi:hypothetical protein
MIYTASVLDEWNIIMKWRWEGNLSQWQSVRHENHMERFGVEPESTWREAGDQLPDAWHSTTTDIPFPCAWFKRHNTKSYCEVAHYMEVSGQLHDQAVLPPG